jgi:HlyD family secretion protein
VAEESSVKGTAPPTEKPKSGAAPPPNPPIASPTVPHPSAVSQPKPAAKKPAPRKRSGTPAAIVVALLVIGIVAVSAWYLAVPPPLMIQGEADSTRTDIAARVDGRVAEIPIERGQDVTAGTVLIRIDNPELVAKYQEALANQAVAEAELARIHAGTRPEMVAISKAQVQSAASQLALAQQTYDRIRKLAAGQFATQQKLDEASDNLRVAGQSYNQAQLGYQQSIAGFTREEVQLAEAKVADAAASAQTLKALVDQMVVPAPTAGQIYQIDIEQGEVVSPGIPLLSVVDLNDVWLRFDLREDLVRGLKVGDRLTVRVPALGDRRVEAEVRLIATRGEYAGWRATRATGDFDLRTFQIRAYPVARIADLRPGMSAYADWAGARR